METGGGCRVSYIAGLRSPLKGIVMSADTQETYELGEDVDYVEKLIVQHVNTYDLCIAGAGRGELVDGFIQHLAETVRKKRPADDDSLASVIRIALKHFYANDVRLLPSGSKEVQFLIAARPTNGKEPTLWKTKSLRLFPISDYAVIGYEAPFCRYVIGRLYNATFPIDNIVVMSAWLVSIAKETSKSVGGQTKIVTIDVTGIRSATAEEIRVLSAKTPELDDAFTVLMSISQDVIAKQIGSSAPPLSLEFIDGKLRLSTPQERTLPIGAVNWFDADTYRVLAMVHTFLRSFGGSVRAGDIQITPTSKALLNEAISDFNEARILSIDWHNAALSAQTEGAPIPPTEAVAVAIQRVQATFVLFLTHLIKEIALRPPLDSQTSTG
jgi:20S proteasome alpha/beta subunit